MNWRLLKYLFASGAVLLHSCSPTYQKVLKQKGDLCAGIADTRPLGVLKGLSLDAGRMKYETGVCSLENGGESLVIRAWLCDNAQKTLDIQYYIFSRDNTGLIACDYLVRAADRGVKIRLIVDDATAKTGRHEIYTLDTHKNIEIKIYNPGVKIGDPITRLWKMITKGKQLQRRMHVKSLTVDEQVSIVGGRNIADEYFDYDKHYNFLDRDVMLIGKTVATVKNSFEEYWNDPLSVPYEELVNIRRKKARDSHRFDRLHQYACDTENFTPRMRAKIRNFPASYAALEQAGTIVWLREVSYVTDAPGKNSGAGFAARCTDSLLALIKSAKTSIDIQSPYLITTDTGKELLRQLVQRGVKVRVLTNSLGATDNYEAFSGYQRDREKTLATGIGIYEFRPDAQIRYKIMTDEVQAAMNYSPVIGLHAKSMVIDGNIAVIGSFNLDPRSVNLNTECVAIIRSREVAGLLLKYMNEAFLPENAWHTTTDYNPDKEAGNNKRAKAATRKVIPKKVL
jgi:phosphatidylserine/phosphatidylglycerophosphate/cardiolipin synthase-like enzyme